jgi:hypothetical protein
MDYEDFDDEIETEGELEGEDQPWDEETLGLEWDESEAQSIVRDLGITSAL